MIAWILVIVGAVAWGLIGFFDYNLVSEWTSKWAWMERFIYGAVGISALWLLAPKIKK